jgi:hypothetical protein
MVLKINTMNIMKRLSTLLITAFAFVACAHNGVEDNAPIDNVASSVELVVGFESQSATRIQLNENLKTVWNRGDEVSVFYKSLENQKWNFNGEDGDRIGTLTSTDAMIGEQSLDNIVIVYPYNEKYTLLGQTLGLNVDLPAEQSYKSGSYGANGNIMVAESELSSFVLRSVFGWLRIELTGAGENIRRITVKGNKGEQIAGEYLINTNTAEITPNADGKTLDSVTLDCGTGVQLCETATSFYIGLPPMQFEKGFTVTIEAEGYEPKMLTTTRALTIERNHIKPMECLTFEAEVYTPKNQILYTSTDENIVTPNDVTAFGGIEILSNEYIDGIGVITFSEDVTTVGDKAFRNCKTLKSITLGNAVTSIGKSAFYNCNKLGNITIAPSIKSIGSDAFISCSNLGIVYIEDIAAWCNIEFATSTSNPLYYARNLYVDGEKLTNLIIPESVTSINQYAFMRCSHLKSVTLHDAVISIGPFAFHSCSGLTEITIGNGVESIGDMAFYDCGSLKSVTIPDSVKLIDVNAFYCCGSLINVYLGSGVETIGANAFHSCSKLENISIPESVVSIGDEAFRDCSAFTSITIGQGVKSIGARAFSGCDNLESVVMSDSVESVGLNVFGYCHNLEEFSGKYASIDGRCLVVDGAIVAFAPFGVVDYTIPDGVTHINDSIFESCSELSTVTIPGSLKSIGSKGFAYCNSLQGVYISDIASWCDITFGDHLSNPLFYSKYLYINGELITDLVIPDGVTRISNRAFQRCSNITSVTMGMDVASIGDYAFNDCINIKNMNISDSVTTIGEYALEDCDGLTTLTIGSGVKKIGKLAIFSCENLSQIYCKAVVPPSYGEKAMDKNASNRTIYVPSASVNVYKDAHGWSRYKSDIVGYDFENGVVVE